MAYRFDRFLTTHSACTNRRALPLGHHPIAGPGPGRIWLGAARSRLRRSAIYRCNGDLRLRLAGSCAPSGPEGQGGPARFQRVAIALAIVERRAEYPGAVNG
jgi:hypothetical protein